MPYKVKKPDVFLVLMALAVAGLAGRMFDIATFDVGAAVAVEHKENAAPMKLVDTGARDTGADEHKSMSSDNKNPPLPEKMPEEDVRAFSPAEIEVLKSLAARRTALEKREGALREREALLSAAEQEVDKKISELNRMKAEMKTLLGQQQEAEEKRLRSLVKIYENMKPKEAARIFDALEMNILLDVIGRMNERKASPILASMTPEKAKNVTMQLADQRRLPGEKKFAE
ncbi:MAG: hypothetical protein OXT65_07680 [Alphaproteobacteria bacterium]|nr:hypothetical protein [Alphaproteobacteria bacterium]